MLFYQGIRKDTRLELATDAKRLMDPQGMDNL